MSESKSKAGERSDTAVAPLFDSSEDFEVQFRREHPTAWLLTLIGPPLITCVMLFSITVSSGAEYAGRLIWAGLATLLVFGRFVILGGEDGNLRDIGEFLTSEQLFLLVSYMDLMIALVLAFHIGFMYKLPFVGPKIKGLVADGHFILNYHPWMKRTTLLGLGAFILFPLTATGSIGGTILGRLLGMGRLITFVGISISSLAANSLMYFGSDLMNAYLDKDHPLLKYGGTVMILVLIILVERRYQKLKRQHLAETEAKADAPPVVEEPIESVPTPAATERPPVQISGE